jgi:hypothetical protein
MCDESITVAASDLFKMSEAYPDAYGHATQDSVLKLH